MNAQQALHPPDAADSGDIVIRAARPIDCEGIAALGNMPGYRWGTLRVPYQTPEATRKWLETMAPGNISLVVEKDGRIIGNGGFERLQGRRSHVAYLGMGLHDDFHGRGIGTRLLRELIEDRRRLAEPAPDRAHGLCGQCAGHRALRAAAASRSRAPTGTMPSGAAPSSMPMPWRGSKLEICDRMRLAVSGRGT